MTLNSPTLTGISMSSKHFRLLLIASLIFGLVGAFFDVMFPSAIPEALSDAQEAHDAKLSMPTLIYLGLGALISVITSVTAFIGLYIFRPWAPRLAIIATALTMLIYPALGVSLFSGWAASLNEISSILWGVVLAMVYFSPLKERFVATR